MRIVGCLCLVACATSTTLDADDADRESDVGVIDVGGSDRDTGVEPDTSTGPGRVTLPGFDEPPPFPDAGSAADSLHRYCYYRAQILCEGNFNCCDDAARRYEDLDLVEWCKSVLERECTDIGHDEEAFEDVSVDIAAVNAHLEAGVAAFEACDSFDFSYHQLFRGSREEGETCDIEGQQFENILCRPDLVCLRDVCAPPARAGETCQLWDCEPNSLCLDSVCFEPVEIDEACERDLACDSQRCSDDVDPVCTPFSAANRTWCYAT